MATVCVKGLTPCLADVSELSIISPTAYICFRYRLGTDSVEVSLLYIFTQFYVTLGCPSADISTFCEPRKVFCLRTIVKN